MGKRVSKFHSTSVIHHLNQSESSSSQSEFGVSPDATENPMQRVRFAPDFARLGLQTWFGNRNHAQEEFGFARFFAASADAMLEIRFGNGVVGLTIVRADARSGADELINQPVVDRTPRNLLGEKNYGFPKASRPFFQIVHERRSFVAQREVFICWSKAPESQLLNRTFFQAFCHSIRHLSFVIVIVIRHSSFFIFPDAR